MLVNQKKWHWKPDVLQQHCFCITAIFAVTPSPTQKPTKLMHISLGLLDRTLPINQLLTEPGSSFYNLVDNRITVMQRQRDIF